MKHCSFTMSFEEAISIEDVDLVDIALLNYLHHVAVFKALGNSKHVVYGKHLVANSEPTWELRYIAQEEIDLANNKARIRETMERIEENDVTDEDRHSSSNKH